MPSRFKGKSSVQTFDEIHQRTVRAPRVKNSRSPECPEAEDWGNDPEKVYGHLNKYISRNKATCTNSRHQQYSVSSGPKFDRKILTGSKRLWDPGFFHPLTPAGAKNMPKSIYSANSLYKQDPLPWLGAKDKSKTSKFFALAWPTVRMCRMIIAPDVVERRAQAVIENEPENTERPTGTAERPGLSAETVYPCSSSEQRPSEQHTHSGSLSASPIDNELHKLGNSAIKPDTFRPENSSATHDGKGSASSSGCEFQQRTGSALGERVLHCEDSSLAENSEIASTLEKELMDNTALENAAGNRMSENRQECSENKSENEEEHEHWDLQVQGRRQSAPVEAKGSSTHQTRLNRAYTTPVPSEATETRVSVTENLSALFLRATNIQPARVTKIACKTEVDSTLSSTLGSSMRQSFSSASENDEFMPEFDENEKYVEFSLLEQDVLHKYFDIHDLNNSGGLGPVELAKAIDDMHRKPAPGSTDATMFDRLHEHIDHNHDGELDFQEFLEFLATFYVGVYHRIFKARSNKHGHVHLDFLSPMLHELGSIGFSVEYVHLDHIMQMAGNTLEQKFDFASFCVLMKEYRVLEFLHLQKTAGFPVERLQLLEEMFREYDGDETGTLEIKEIAHLFQKVFRPIDDAEAFVQIFAQIDRDRTASLDFHEFLRLISVWNKHLARTSQEDETTKSESPLDELAETEEFQKQGQGSSQETQTSQAAKLKKHVDELQQWDPLNKKHSVFENEAEKKRWEALYSRAWIEEAEAGVLAQQWGIPLDEVQALRESFEFCDFDGSGILDEGELKILLPSAGLLMNTGCQQRIFTQSLSDFKQKGRDLDFKNIVALIGKYHENLAREVVKIFGDEERKAFPMDQVIMALYQIGEFLTQNQVKSLLGQTGIAQDAEYIDEAQFRHILDQRRRSNLLKWTETYGFDEKELQRFRLVFANHECPEVEYQGTIKLSSVKIFAQQLGFIDKMGLKSERKADKNLILETLTRLDLDNTGRLKFSECLLLLRHLYNRRLHLIKQKENEVIESRRLDPDTVRVFREVFISCAPPEERDPSGTNAFVSEAGIRRLLTIQFRIVTTEKQRLKLDQALHDVYQEHTSDSSRPPSANSSHPTESGAHDQRKGARKSNSSAFGKYTCPTGKNLVSQELTYRFNFAEFLLILGKLDECGAF